ncbi:MAG: hypothetical protein AAGE52_35225 [Myxococcota bacterium]
MTEMIPHDRARAAADAMVPSFAKLFPLPIAQERANNFAAALQGCELSEFVEVLMACIAARCEHLIDLPPVDAKDILVEIAVAWLRAMVKQSNAQDLLSLRLLGFDEPYGLLAARLNRAGKEAA